MDLRGWDYTGRNIGPELHRQFRIMIDCLADNSFVNHRTWGNSIQDDLAERIGVASSGVIRTIKRIFENFGLINTDALNTRVEIDSQKLLTKRGQLVYYLANLEKSISESKDLDDQHKEASAKKIKNLYEEAYCDALKGYYYDNGDGTYLMPLRATLRAVEKYGTMDKWEWYLMNTFIRHDDDPDEEAQLEEYIKKYRSGQYQFDMRNVVEKPKGHQYIPQYFEYAGIFKVIQRPDWSISLSGRHQDVIAEVLSPDFLDRLHQGGVQK